MTVRDFLNADSLMPSVVIQLIRPTISPITISRVIHSFDLDICSAAFNSKDVIISFACMQALSTGHSTYYAMSNNRNKLIRQLRRLYKYHQRGYNILCPKNFDLQHFLSTSIENPNANAEQQSYSSHRQYFGDNCDFFQVQKRFCEHYGLI